ncbi:MAG TPA: hypothetical protein PKA06_01205, partial [Gemmatales bacterium]|nr:hypothetical protein [Gemmatales bacterium]
ACIVMHFYQQQARLRFWQDLAAETGGQLHLHDVYRFTSSQEYPLFRNGHSRKVQYLLECQKDNHSFIYFDYQYKTGSGKNQATHSLSGMMITMPIYGPALTLRCENFLDRIASFMGFDDINFELESFNRAFRVHCADKKFAYDVFHTGMMEFFLEHKQGLIMEWCGMKALFYFSPARRFQKADIDYLTHFATNFVQRLPAYLHDQHRGT